MFILDIRDYLTYDLKLSDTAFNDLFSEFDLNPNDFQYLDTSANANTYSQHSALNHNELPPPYDSTMLTTPITAPLNTITQTPNAQTMEPVIDDYISSVALKSLIEQHQAQQPIVKYSSSPPPPPAPCSIPIPQTNYQEVIQNKAVSYFLCCLFVYISGFIHGIHGYIRTSVE